MRPIALSSPDFYRSDLILLSLGLAAAIVNPSYARGEQPAQTPAPVVSPSQSAGAPPRSVAGQTYATTNPTAGGTTVVAAHPVVYWLLQALTQGSSIVPIRATPANLPVTRHYSYLSGRGAKAFDRLVRKADAVIDLRSIWPDDPLYPLARQHNIRVVQIDAANPIDHRLPGIAAASGADSIAAYPWLNPVNMGRMADIIASEIQRLQPDAAGQVEKNLASLRQRLVRLTANTESALLEASDLSVIALSPRLNTLASAFNLDIVPVKATTQWSEQAMAELEKTITDNNVRVVLLHDTTRPELEETISRAGAKAVLVQTEGDDPVAVLEAAGQKLVQALAPGSPGR